MKKNRKKEPKQGKKRSALHPLTSWLHSVEAKCVFAFIATALVLFVLFCVTATPEKYSLTVGSISHYTITATKDVVDEVTTNERREAAANAVEATYRFEEGVSEQVMLNLENTFRELRTVQQYGLTLRQEGETDAELRSRTFTEEELQYAHNLITTITLTNYQISTLLRTETEDFEEMVSSVTTAVQNTLNTTVREGQVSSSITTVLQIVGYKVETSLFQNIVPTVLRSCLQPNMVIDQETTEQARQRARDEVEAVTYLQGQNIIREGERVTANQLQMLKTLGLLNDDAADYTNYYGGALLIAVAMAMLFIMLRLLVPDILHDIRRLAVVLLVVLITMLLCTLSVRFIAPYAAPAAMAAMLLTCLLGTQEGIAIALPMTMMTCTLVLGNSSSYTTEAIQLTIISFCGSVASVMFLKDKPQRLRMVVCGFLVALVNLVLVTTVNVLTTNEIDFLRENVLQAAGGGFGAGLLALGIQPLLESLFNLATPSKLLELANPNQPLLRRLLIEASGTYHHSIIVANLAEAAAEKIGANPLLARTGAYFHDIGKLKRPLYFKENQMGDNPHDRTDPYVSAAIVTNHTRDGYLLAQKYHLPPEIQRIILEHHGDTPVMFFYHKALQLADGKPVDVADFRYEGPRPTMKESAIVMLADTVEAAVRSMEDPTPQAIERFIDRLVRGKLEDGQLSDAPLTLHDIDGICEAFATVLNGAFHDRIEYPTVDMPRRDVFSREENKTPEAAAAEGAVREKAAAEGDKA